MNALDKPVRISVIIPTLNAAAWLPELLARLKSQSLPPAEILVVDSSSSDGTAELAAAHGARVVTVARGEFDHGGTRNLAARQATGDVLVFLTQDALPVDDEVLAALVRPLGEEGVAAVCGRQVPRPGADVLDRTAREFNYPPEPSRKTLADADRYGIKTFFFSNVCSAVRRDAFEKAGGFPEPAILNEDMILVARLMLAGYAVAYEPGARVWHSHRYSPAQQFRRYFDIGVSLRMNDWLLRYARAEGEGVRLLRHQLRVLFRERRWETAPRLAMEAAAKYAGYRIGLAYRKLPLFLCRRFSMHRHFWDRGKPHGLKPDGSGTGV